MAAYGKAVAIIATVSVLGGIIACGVFLLLIAIVGLIGAIKHHQVILFFVSLIQQFILLNMDDDDDLCTCPELNRCCKLLEKSIKIKLQIKADTEHK